MNIGQEVKVVVFEPIDAEETLVVKEAIVEAIDETVLVDANA